MAKNKQPTRDNDTTVSIQDSQQQYQETNNVTTQTPQQQAQQEETVITVQAAMQQMRILLDRFNATKQQPLIALKIAGTVNGVNPKLFEESARASFQSAVQLKENRKRLKAAVVQSNATTEIVVGGETMTVARALERKANITHDKLYLEHLVVQYDTAMRQLEAHNNRVRREAEQSAGSFLQNATAENKAEEHNRLVQEYIARNGATLVDPIGLKEQIEKLRNDIAVFERDVDLAITASNVTTMIRVRLYPQ